MTEGKRYSDAQLRAYRALQKAGERIGLNNYRSGRYKIRYRHGVPIGGYTITPEHQEIVDAMPKVLSGEITPEEAMALLWQYDTMRQRLGE